MPLVLALDVGGTFIKSAVIDTSAGIKRERINVQRHPTSLADDAGESLVQQLISLTQLAAAEAAIEAVGIVTPGLLNETAGVINYATNLRVRNLPLRERVEAATGLPVGFGHDGRAAALAEHVAGAGMQFNNFALMPIGTGISVGLVIDGRLPTADGYIGEIGHANVGHEVECGCGMTGCLEAVASTSALSRRYLAATGVAKDAAGVISAAQTGDRSAAEIWSDALDGIAVSCDWLMNLLGPEAICFAGGLSSAGDALLTGVGERLDRRVSFQRRPQLTIAELGDDAGCIGAAILAERRLTE